jgi:transposase
MFGVSAATRVYFAAGAADMRKSYEGLYGLARDQLGCDPLSGHLFLFANARRTRLKVLVFDGSGLGACGKRLEKGRFRWPEGADTGRVEMRTEELTLLRNGIGLERARARRWFRKASV